MVQILLQDPRVDPLFVTLNIMIETSKYDKTNENGALLCHAVGCRKHTKLIEIYRGLFCNIHAKALSVR